MFAAIGHVLRMKRLVRNLTQKEVAEKIEVSVYMVSGWENDRYFPSLLRLKQLASLYSISVEELRDYDYLDRP
ncbi:helix-turn-helix transcriptional regulator [Cytobacillus pseudoceanisediminis]|uniref:helix-turn-helix transcriptional regulator n=1 Tax=Cytobacillus pseudoceanisediminis TaxID=3051614 RepID=UPI003C2B8752